MDDAEGRRSHAAGARARRPALKEDGRKPCQAPKSIRRLVAALTGGWPPGGRSTSGRGVWALALTAGLIAGFASWLIGESVHGRFAPPDTRTGRRLSAADFKSRTMAKDAAQELEATLAYGSLGAVLGLVTSAWRAAAPGSASERPRLRRSPDRSSGVPLVPSCPACSCRSISECTIRIAMT